MRRALPVLLLAAAWASACSPANVGTVDAGATAGTACGDSAYARCSHLQSCSPTAVQQRDGDVTTCEALFKSYCLANLAAPSTGTTGAKQEACAQAIPGWDCGDYLLGQNAPPECQQAAGALASGAACAFPAQCQSGFCAIVLGAACGTCAAPPQSGDSCAQLTSCGFALTCDADTSTCVAPAQAAAACAPGQSCVPGNECVGENAAMGTSGTCQLAVESLGGACSSTTNECDFFAGLTCNTQSKQCAALALVGAGQPCNYVVSAGQEMVCASGGKCLSATPGMQGTCAGSSAVGGPCDLATGPFCIEPSRCIVGADGGTGGTCQIADGTMCH
jgi:hypothetical protein